MHMILVRHMIYGVISSSSRPASLLLTLPNGTTKKQEVKEQKLKLFFDTK